jgi:hypothetical protein
MKIVFWKIFYSYNLDPYCASWNISKEEHCFRKCGIIELDFQRNICEIVHWNIDKPKKIQNKEQNEDY